MSDAIENRATREDVVREALSWCGTPFHDACSVKGHGADCVGLLIGVFANVGLIERFTPEPYKPQWFLHHDEPRFLNGLEKYAHRIEAPEIGDVVMINFGRHAAHSAILVAERAIVHAYKPVGRVTRDSLDGHLHRVHSYWSIF